MANDQQAPTNVALTPADRPPIDARVFHLASGAVWEVEAVWPQPDSARITAEAALQFYLAQKIAAGDGPEAMRARTAVQGKKARYDAQLKQFRELQKKENLPDVQYAQVSHIFNRPNGRVEIFAVPFGPWEKVGITISTSLPLDEVMIDTIWGVNTIKTQIEKLTMEAEQAAAEEDEEDTVTCGACEETVADAAFCSACGAELEEEEEEEGGDESDDEDAGDATASAEAPPAPAPEDLPPDDDFRPRGGIYGATEE